MNLLTAEEAKEKADNSEQSYKILGSAIYNNIECAANQGHYKVEVEKPTTYLLACRLHKELENNGYSVSHRGFAEDTYPFSISWENPRTI